MTFQRKLDQDGKQQEYKDSEPNGKTTGQKQQESNINSGDKIEKGNYYAFYSDSGLGDQEYIHSEQGEVKPEITYKRGTKHYEVEKNLIKNLIFKNTEDPNFKMCSLNDCTHRVSSARFHLNNARKHLKTNHNVLYAEMLVKEIEKSERSTLKRYGIGNKRTKRERTGRFITVPSFSITLEEFKTTVVNMFSIEGRPFSMADSPNFKFLLKCYTDALKMEINSKNVKSWILETAEIKRNEIIQYIKGRKLSIKFDTSSKFRKKFLSVNIQFSDNGRIVLLNLSVKRYIIKSTGENIKEMVEEILESFEIEKDQVISIVIDNGKNMVNAAERYMKDALDTNKKNLEENAMLESDDIGYFYDVTDIEKINKEVYEIFEPSGIQIIKCGAHTLQLCIKDFYETISEETGDFLTVNTLIKQIKSNKYGPLFEKYKIKIPHTEIVTRWDSRYNSHKDLLEIKNFLQEKTNDYPGFFMADKYWEQVKTVNDLLEPCNLFTIKMQKIQYSLSDFVKDYKILISKIENISGENTYKNTMMDCLKNRLVPLLKEPIFLLKAEFLDPRLLKLMTPEYKNIARDTLKKLFLKMELSIKNKHNEPQEDTPKKLKDIRRDEEVFFEELYKKNFVKKSEGTSFESQIFYYESLNNFDFNKNKTLLIIGFRLKRS